ncbi:MAG: YpdA family putative bacillithiol disulfide reductase [Trueperaceae bacterium]
MLDLIIIGAGPIGLEAAIAAKRAGLEHRVLEKGALVQAIVDYPTYMTFFTTSERLEIGGHPMVTATDKPSRKEALDYYRKVTHAEGLQVDTFTTVTDLRRLPGGGFEIDARDRLGRTSSLRAAKVALATGYFDNPNLLRVPGEDLPHVSHVYDEAHPYYGREVTIVGAGSSAADAALDLFRGGARVTMVHRGDDFRHSLKYWIRPNLENRVKEGSIRVHFRTAVKGIEADALLAERDGETLRIPSERVFLLTGYHASTELLMRVGAQVDPVTLAAKLDRWYQTTVPGLYCLGSAGFGHRTSDVFIENGLQHVAAALPHIAGRVGTGEPAA